MPPRPLPKGMFVRNGTYYVQLRVPKVLQEHPSFRGKKFIKKSLHTKDPDVADRKGATVRGDIEREFEDARREVELRNAPQRRTQMTEDEAQAFVERTLLAHRMAASFGGIAGIAPPVEGEAVRWAGELHNLELGEDLEAQLKDRFFKWLSTPPLPVSAADRLLAKEREALAPMYAPPPPRKAMTLAGLIQAFESDDDRQKLQPETKRNFATSFRVLKEVLGEGRNIKSIIRADLNDVRRILLHLPPHADRLVKKDSRYTGWSYRRLADDAMDRLTAGQEVDVLTPATAAKYLRGISTLFGYAITQQYIDANPAMKLAPRRTEDEAAAGWWSFSDEQLQALFPRGWRPHSDVDWIFLLGLYQGARGNEIAQLELADIDEEDGIPVIHITRMDRLTGKQSLTKRLKNNGTARRIPIHKKVIELGFLDFVARRRREGAHRLFSMTPYNGYCYEGIRDDLTERLIEAGVKTDKHVFHSLRHSFRDACRNANISRERAHELGGWSNGSSSGGWGNSSRSGAWSNGSSSGDAYGSGTNIRLLKEEIDRVSYNIEI